MSGIDLDVIDITSHLTAGQTAADAEILANPIDGIQTMIWWTSISSLNPILDVTKEAVGVDDAGVVQEGDEVSYSIVVTNDGDDAAANTVFNDVLSSDLEFVAGSLAIDGSAVTDTSGDDRGEFEAGSRTLRARLGTGATASAGGSLAPNASTTVTFKARAAAGSAGKTISNQASVEAAGASGSAKETVKSDGDSSVTGSQPTTIVVKPKADAGTDGGGVGGAGGSGGSPATGGSSGSTGTGGSTGSGDSLGSAGTAGSSAGGSGTGGGSRASDPQIHTGASGFARVGGAARTGPPAAIGPARATVRTTASSYSCCAHGCLGAVL